MRRSKVFRLGCIGKWFARAASSVILATITIAAAVPAFATTLPDSTLDRVHIMTLSGTDAIILESNGIFGMVDSGEDDDYPDGSDPRYPLRAGVTQGWGHEDEVIAYMRELGVTQDNFLFYIGTHPHSDHIGSADEVIREFHPKRVYIPEYEDEYIANPAALWDNLYVYDRMLEAAYEVGATIIWGLDPNAPVEPEMPEVDNEEQVMLAFGDPLGSHEGCEIEDGPEPQHDPVEPGGNGGADVQGSVESDSGQDKGHAVEGTIGNPNFSLGDLKIEIVNYDSSYQTERSGDANWFSWGVKVSGFGKSVFLSGDIGNYDGDEDRLAKTLGNVDVLKMGHHGLSTSSTPEFLKALSPDYALQTGSYSFMPLDRIDTLDAMGTRLYCADSSAAMGYRAFTMSFSDRGLDLDAPTTAVMLEDRGDGPRRTAYLDGRKTVLNGWFFDETSWSWFDSSPYATSDSWLNLNGTWYLLNETGRMATGWAKKDGAWYLLDASGAMLSGWQQLSGTWYYLAPSGAMATGWINLGGSWYWLNPDDGAMTTGWIHDGSAWYYMEPDGRMVSTGWRVLGGTWYYFDGSGAMRTGWLLDRGSWYWLNPQSGAMATGWALDGSTWYFFDASGRMRSGGWLNDAGSWYWLEPSGAMQTGWLLDGSTWYYLDQSGCMRSGGWLDLAGTWYWLEPSGAMRTGWLQIGGAWYWLGASGAMATGWVHDGSAWYYLDASGRMRSSEWLALGDAQYWLSASGAMHTGWLYNGGSWYWLDPISGVKKTGWLKTGGKTYWLDPETGKMVTGEVEIDGVLHRFKSSGELT